MIIILLTSIVCTPIEIAFSTTPLTDYSAQHIFELVMDFLFFLDMAVTFNVAVLDSENYIIEDNRKTIAKDYLKSWFIIDILSCFPFGLISLSHNLS